MRGQPLTLGIVAALPGEGQCLGTPRLRAGSQVRLHGSVLLRLSGMGPERAATAASALLDQGVEALASWGFAGALDPALRPGALVLAAQVCDMQGRYYAADTVWLDRLCAAVLTRLAISTGTLLTCPAAIRDTTEKRRLERSFAAVAVDMESAAVAAAAQRADLPFIAIRSISDASGTSLPAAALEAIDAEGRLRPARALANVARHPWEVPSLLHLAAGAHSARRTLRALAQLAGARLLAPAHTEPDPAFEAN